MKDNNDNFFIFLACSIALHLLVGYFVLVGLPSFSHKLPEEQIITFESLPVSNISNVPNQQKHKEKTIENAEAKKVQQSKIENTEESKAETPKQQKIEEKAIEKKQEATDNQPSKEAINIAKKEMPKVQKESPPKKDEKKEDKPTNPIKTDKAAKNKKKPVINDLDSLLKNLEQASEGNNNKSDKHSQKQGSHEQDSKGNYNEELPLSISEKALIKKQIEDSWRNIPIGAQDIEKAKILVYITLEQDGSVKQVKISETICSNVSASICQALADSALRAVKQASPLKGLDVERYQVWKEFQFLFDPSEILN